MFRKVNFKILAPFAVAGLLIVAVTRYQLVQTADEQVLPDGTAYMTDVGMTGPHDSVIGAEKEAAVRRFINRMPVRFEPASGDIKLCGVLLDVDEATGKSRSIKRLRIDLEE